MARTYDADEIASRLDAELGSWTFSDGHIRRVYRTQNWKSTCMVIGAIGHLAESAWHHPDVLASFNRVEVRLTTHDAGGITDMDFELARKIENVVMWRPGKEGGALSGAPADPKFAHVTYED